MEPTQDTGTRPSDLDTAASAHQPLGASTSRPPAAGGPVRSTTRTAAAEPNDLSRYWIERANAGDVEGLVALYEPNAVLAFPPGHLATGHAEIRRVYEQLVAAAPPLLPGRQHAALVSDDLAMTTCTQSGGEVSVEVARRQPDGSWLWAIDEPALQP
jgi:ketosteroid isomerase-like protein